MLINATPHPVRISDGTGSFIVLDPRGRPARVRREPVQVGTFPLEGSDIPFYSARVDGFKGLPAPQDGVTYLVSSEVAREGRHYRDDLVAPYVFIRENGQVQGCHALIRYI